MSQLYVRVMTGFYTHRKTAKLRTLVGEAAWWLPPRIWAYCAENQADGDLSEYSADQLALLIGYSGNAQAMLQALKDSGFIDNQGFIHDWSEHNGYHKSFSDRARTAARARWDKEKPPTPPKEGNRKEESGDKHCSTHACSIPEALNTPEFLAAWAEWQQHRSEKRNKLTPTSIKRQMNLMEKLGPAQAVLAINQSIQNGYTGIFPASHQKPIRKDLTPNGTVKPWGSANPSPKPW